MPSGDLHKSLQMQRLRIAAISIAVFFFLWLPVEDLHERTVVLLAVAIAAWIGARFMLVLSSTKGSAFVIYHALIGLLCGSGISPLAVSLMAIKTGLHGHEVPDFTPAQIQNVLWLAPYFAISGLLIGLGSGFLRKFLGEDATKS
jgi:hypothetical protein